MPSHSPIPGGRKHYLDRSCGCLRCLTWKVQRNGDVDTQWSQKRRIVVVVALVTFVVVVVVAVVVVVDVSAVVAVVVVVVVVVVVPISCGTLPLPNSTDTFLSHAPLKRNPWSSEFIKLMLEQTIWQPLLQRLTNTSTKCKYDLFFMETRRMQRAQLWYFTSKYPYHQCMVYLPTCQCGCFLFLS